MAQRKDWDHMRQVCAAAGPEVAWLFERYYEHEQRFNRQDQRLDAIEVCHEQYAALQEAHEALQLEHEDLQAAYYLARRALRRREKEEKTEDDLS